MGAKVIGGRYELLREIGRGGMGTVYAGREVGGGRPCAIKVLREEATLGADARQRFEREARAPQRIGHPGLVEVLDAFIGEDGSMVLVMELLTGVPFRPILDEPGGLEGKLAVLLGALDPLAAAHAAGFVHRDMKPDNIFLAEDGEGSQRVKLLDFGIARDLGSGALTQTGVIVGSVRYISPEQAHSARRVEPTADVYSVGVMLYEAATGKLPHGSESALKTLTSLASGTFPPLDQVVSGLPPGLVDVVHECLAFDPAARPRDASALRERLTAVAPDLPPVGTKRVASSSGTEWASQVRSIVKTPSVPTPMQGAESGRRAKGTSFVHMIKSVKVALAGGLALPLEPDDRAWLNQRVIVSNWYPFERFQWLIELVHEHLMGGTDGAALKMGQMAANHLLTSVHSGFVYPGDISRSLCRMPNAWTRYFGFGDVLVDIEREGEAVVSITNYAFMPRVHELMLIGWVLQLIALSDGVVTSHEIIHAPSRGDAELTIRLEYRNA